MSWTRARRRAEYASDYASDHRWSKLVDDKAARLGEDAAAKPLAAYEALELGEMARDMVDDRHGFADKRHRFMYKR